MSAALCLAQAVQALGGDFLTISVGDGVSPVVFHRAASRLGGRLRRDLAIVMPRRGGLMSTMDEGAA